MGKQSVAWKEYYAEYRLKEPQESMYRCSVRRDITEILLKTALNTIRSINQCKNPVICTKTIGTKGESNTVVSAYTIVKTGESNTVVSAYTMYRHLQQYCSHP